VFIVKGGQSRRSDPSPPITVIVVIVEEEDRKKNLIKEKEKRAVTCLSNCGEFYRLSVMRKKALTSSLVDLETSKYRFWRFIF
jgi:hypothetical protein